MYEAYDRRVKRDLAQGQKLCLRYQSWGRALPGTAKAVVPTVLHDLRGVDSPAEAAVQFLRLLDR